jgi:hypothetical protein
VEIADRDGLNRVHGFDDPRVIAGQGTMALEILEDVPDVDAIVVPTGGAGLLAGVSLVAKSLRPDVRIIAVEPVAAGSLGASLAAGRPVQVPIRPTLADGLAVGKVNCRSRSRRPWSIASSPSARRRCRWPSCGSWNWKRRSSKGRGRRRWRASWATPEPNWPAGGS